MIRAFPARMLVVRGPAEVGMVTLDLVEPPVFDINLVTHNRVQKKPLQFFPEEKKSHLLSGTFVLLQFSESRQTRPRQ
jgi:hypothetical protein